MVLSDDFIEGVITPETETTNPSTMVYREFNGMKAVAKFDDEFMDAQSVARGEDRDGGEE
jgi:hypothetical protein